MIVDAQVAALDGVRADAALEDRLRRGADATFRAFGSGGGLERYWRLAVEGLNERFRAAEVRGDDRLRATALRRVPCAGLRRVRWVDPAGPFYDAPPGAGPAGAVMPFTHQPRGLVSSGRAPPTKMSLTQTDQKCLKTPTEQF